MKRESMGLAIAVFTLVLMVQAVPSFAATQVDVEWDTSGSIGISVFADDDAETYFNSEGYHIFGEFHAIDHNDNPYSYNVDTFDVWAAAQVEGGGYIEFKTVRTDSYEPMYGDAGQQRWAYVEASEWGFLKYRDNTNYARLRCAEYGFQSDNQFQASGNFLVSYSIFDSDWDGAWFEGYGEGEISVTLMNAEAWGSSWKFGKGCGCYTNAHAEGTGHGVFSVGGWADNYLQSDLGFELPNGGNYYLSISYDGGFSIDNFASEGH